jgi:subtilisin family serine protease
MRSSTIFALAAIAALTLQGCHDQRAPTALAGGGVLAASVTPAEPASRYLVLFAAERVPVDFGEHISRLGGSVEVRLDSIGVAAVTGLTEAAAAELVAEPGVLHVEPEVVMTMPDDSGAVAEEAASETFAPADATASPTSAQFYPRQWNIRAVFADKAWEAGHFGSRDVVVAILDTGIDYLHPDLEGLVDLARSTSFVPEDDAFIAERFPGRLPISDIRGHGTGTASIVASNAKVVAGINRDVTLIAVKIWNRVGQGTVARLLSGIVHAADQGADVINVSGTETFDKSQNPGFLAAVERAANYAFRKGALLVGIAGNDAADLDHSGDTVRMPCEAALAICASATGPTSAGTVNGPWVDVDARAPYSGFGRSAIDVAAPGGEIVPGQFRGVWLPCTTTPTETTVFPPCRARQPLSQGRGTSWAAPHISGLAALLVAQLGHGNPALIRARILQSADDLGEPGTDPYYGKGRINIARALGLIN